MSVTIGQDGSIRTVATTRFPLLARVKQTPVVTKTVLSKHGLTIETSMPGVIAKQQAAVTTIHFSPADLVLILRTKLASSEMGEKMRQAVLDIPEDRAVDWIEYFLQKLS